MNTWISGTELPVFFPDLRLVFGLISNIGSDFGSKAERSQLEGLMRPGLTLFNYNIS